MWTVPWTPPSFLFFLSLLGSFLPMRLPGIWYLLCQWRQRLVSCSGQTQRLSVWHPRQKERAREPGRSLILVCQKVKTSCGCAHALMNNRTLEVSGRRCAASQQDFIVRFCLELFRNEEEGESCILTKWILKEMQLHQNFCSGGIGLSLWSLWDSRHSLSISKHWRIWRARPLSDHFFPFSCTFQQNLCQIVQ